MRTHRTLSRTAYLIGRSPFRPLVLNVLKIEMHVNPLSKSAFQFFPAMPTKRSRPVSKRPPRRYKRSRRTPNPAMVSRRPLNFHPGLSDGFPDSQITKLVYEDRNLLTASTAGSDVVWQFRMNSCYDPDYTNVTGNQPTGFDQWSTVYAKYSVYAAKIDLDVINPDANVKLAALCCTLDATLANMSYAKVSTTSPSRTVTLGATGSGLEIQRMTLFVSYSRMTGTTATEDANVQTFGSNPATPVYFAVSVSPFDVTKVCSIYIRARIKYYVMFSYKKLLGPS